MDYEKKTLRKLFGKSILPKINLSRRNIMINVRLLAGKLSISGVQPKISLALSKNELVPVNTKGQYILKPQNELFENLPENEALCMQIAEEIGINVPPNILVELNDKTLAFLVKRFDRLSYNKKLHMEDFSQILEKDKYKGSYEQIGKYIRTNKNLGLLQVQYFFERVILNFIIGNADAHLKNFSILWENDNKYVLSPAYDIVSSNLAIPEEKDEVALPINGRQIRIRKKDFFELGKFIGLQEDYIKNYIQKSIDFKSEIFHLIDDSFLPEEQKIVFKEIVETKINQLIKY